MPYISSKVSVSMTKQQREAVKAQLGKAIEFIPTKNESWLMVELADNCDMYFGGKQDLPCAYVEVKSFGEIPEESALNLTKAIVEIYKNELGIPGERTYIIYREVTKWGWNGMNF